MTTELINDRGRGPEIVGTRITVYNLLPYFLDPTATEDYIARLYDLTPAQVAAARAYVLGHADTVLARHLEIEARLTAGNPPEVVERARQTRETFERFRDWVAGHELPGKAPRPAEAAPVPTFREWQARQDAAPTPER